MTVFNLLLKGIIFLLPYIIYAFILNVRKFDKKLILWVTIFPCLAFLFCYFVAMGRSVTQLINHIFHPTGKVYALYYAILCTSFLGLPLLHWFVNKIQKIKIFKILSFIFFLISIFSIVAVIWAGARYPIQQPMTVFFVLSSPVEGGIQTSQIISGLIEIVLPLFVFVCLFFFVSRFSKFGKKINLWRWATVGGGVAFFLSTLFFGLRTEIWEYPSLIAANSTPPTFSDFYDKEFKTTNLDDLSFPEEKRNLIVIFLESMESSFTSGTEGGLMKNNLIPNLTSLASQNLNFSHLTKGLGGGIDISGTNWTIAALLSKFSGTPFNPSFIRRNPALLSVFFPKLVTLTDILKNQGYEQRFIFGSEKSFASRGVFLESHGAVEVHDIDWYKNQGLLPKSYEVFWGFEDLKLYEYAKMELTELAEAESPFFFGMLTVDTHGPAGYICPNCVSETGASQIQTVIKCADRQIGDFIEWLSVQEFYEDTTVVIMGDHLFMETESSDLFEYQEVSDNAESSDFKTNSGIRQRWLNIFINSVAEPINSNNRDFSSFDMFPTILESMGIKVPRQGLGFGRSLFGDEPTLLEKYGVDQVNKAVMEKASQYLELLY